MYLISYLYGSHADSSLINLFVTDSEEAAKSYVEKFNRVLWAFVDHNKRYNDHRGEYDSDKWGYGYYLRWVKSREINEAFYTKINKL